MGKFGFPPLGMQRGEQRKPSPAETRGESPQTQDPEGIPLSGPGIREDPPLRILDLRGSPSKNQDSERTPLSGSWI